MILTSVNVKDSWAILRVDKRADMAVLLGSLLKSVDRIHVFLGYQNIFTCGVLDPQLFVGNEVCATKCAKQIGPYTISYC